MEALTITPNLELPPAELSGSMPTWCGSGASRSAWSSCSRPGWSRGPPTATRARRRSRSAPAAARQDDYVASYHRGHGHCIAKGAEVDRMMAELMGRATGYCQGLGGSMHIADMERNILGANGIVGAAMPLGVGAGLAFRCAAATRS